MKLRCRDELLDTVWPEDVTEVRIAELTLEYTLLLFFDPPPCSNANRVIHSSLRLKLAYPSQE